MIRTFPTRCNSETTFPGASEWPEKIVLRIRISSPNLRSPQLAELLTERLGRPVKPGWVRLNLHRPRDMFVKSLLDEVKRSLGSQPQRLDEELKELGLLEYCQSVLNRSADRPEK